MMQYILFGYILSFSTVMCVSQKFLKLLNCTVKLGGGAKIQKKHLGRSTKLLSGGVSIFQKNHLGHSAKWGGLIFISKNHLGHSAKWGGLIFISKNHLVHCTKWGGWVVSGRKSSKYHLVRTTSCIFSMKTPRLQCNVQNLAVKCKCVNGSRQSVDSVLESTQL